MNVAIDGPAGAGKSTIAKKVAGNIGAVYIDTGAMYRTVGLAALNNKIDIIKDPEAVVSLMDTIVIDTKYDASGQRMLLDGVDVSDKIRSEMVSMAASNVSAISQVRVKLVRMQQNLAKVRDCVMDGRDIATHVLPDAECKIFLTASVEKRAQRRFDELNQRGVSCSLDEVSEDIKKRDLNDTTRAASPLVCHKDAIVVDTTELNLSEAVERVMEIVSDIIKKNK